MPQGLINKLMSVFNGQTANRPELNNQQHVVARVSYPLALGRQIIEPGIQAYTGSYVVNREQLSPGVKYRPDLSYPAQRMAAKAAEPRPAGGDGGERPEAGPRQGHPGSHPCRWHDPYA